MSIGNLQVVRDVHNVERTGSIAVITAARDILPFEQVIHGDTTAGSFTITMPNAAECAGLIYIFRNIGTGNTLTIDGGLSDTLAAAASAVWISDGIAFKEL